MPNSRSYNIFLSGCRCLKLQNMLCIAETSVSAEVNLSQTLHELAVIIDMCLGYHCPKGICLQCQICLLLLSLQSWKMISDAYSIGICIFKESN